MVMIFRNQPGVFVIDWSQQPDGTDGAQTSICGGLIYLPLDDILPPPAEDMIDDIGDELDEDGEMPLPNL
jgi:hypothetical protein